MTNFSTFFPGEATLLLRRFFADPGVFNLTVPAGATIARLAAGGCGGQGDSYGGGGAFARSIVNVTPGESLQVQVGNTSTASSNGDSFVKRSGATLVYADRGRGNGEAGLASRSVGDIKRDGQRGLNGTTTFGAPASDATDFGSLGFQGVGVYRVISGSLSSNNLTGPGGGGHNTAYYDDNGVFVAYYATNAAAGTGQVAIEFFDINPGY